MKLPFLQLYPSAWLSDSVSGCSLAAQGLWMRMMFIMHTSERYGYLVENGLPIPPDSVARRCGCYPAEYQPLYAELERAGVPSVSSDGIIYSRRMVRDSQRREKTRNRVTNFRSNAECNASVTPKKLEVRSHISEKPKSYCAPEFQPFWDAYPKKLAKPDAIRAFTRKGCAQVLGEVLAGLETWKKSDQWQDLQFVPYPATWLNREGWREVPVSGKVMADESELARIRELRRVK